MPMPRRSPQFYDEISDNALAAYLKRIVRISLLPKERGLGPGKGGPGERRHAPPPPEGPVGQPAPGGLGRVGPADGDGAHPSGPGGPAPPQPGGGGGRPPDQRPPGLPGG